MKQRDSKVVHVRLEPDLRKYVDQRAAAERRTASGLIRFLIAEAASKGQQQTSAA